MPALCYSSIQGLAMRGTRLDSLGRWVTGATATAVSDGFVSIALNPNVETGTEYRQKKANSAYCVNERGRATTNWYDVEINFCSVDPNLFELFTGARLLSDASANNVGFAIPSQYPETRAALEVWTKVPTPATTAQWVYWLLPMLRNTVVGGLTIEDALMTFTLTGEAYSNNNWGLGPHNVVTNAGGTPTKLTEAVALDLVYTRMTAVAPPVSVCGYVANAVNWITPP